MTKKKSEKPALSDLEMVEACLKKAQDEFEKDMEEERERERKTMERGMAVWINT